MSTGTALQPSLHFDGETYEPKFDQARLSGQLGKVEDLMLRGGWWSLRELHNLAGGSEAGISARLRDLRKPRFGGYQVDRRRVEGGLFEYRISL